MENGNDELRKQSEFILEDLHWPRSHRIPRSQKCKIIFQLMVPGFKVEDFIQTRLLGNFGYLYHLFFLPFSLLLLYSLLFRLGVNAILQACVHFYWMFHNEYLKIQNSLQLDNINKHYSIKSMNICLLLLLTVNK